jgi:hypothetical protein
MSEKKSVRMYNLYVFDLENYKEVRPDYTYKWGLYRPVIIGKYIGKEGNKYIFDLNGIQKTYRPDQLNGKLNIANAGRQDINEASSEILKNKGGVNYERPENEYRKKSFFGYGGKKSRRGYRSKKRNNKKRKTRKNNSKK